MEKIEMIEVGKDVTYDYIHLRYVDFVSMIQVEKQVGIITFKNGDKSDKVRGNIELLDNNIYIELFEPYGLLRKKIYYVVGSLYRLSPNKEDIDYGGINCGIFIISREHKDCVDEIINTFDVFYLCNIELKVLPRYTIPDNCTMLSFIGEPNESMINKLAYVTFKSAPKNPVRVLIMPGNKIRIYDFNVHRLCLGLNYEFETNFKRHLDGYRFSLTTETGLTENFNIYLPKDDEKENGPTIQINQATNQN